jgi:hypothetical protein
VKKGKKSKMHNQVDSSVTLMHGQSHIRESVMMPLKLHGIGGQNDWDEVIGKMVVR